MTHFEDILGPTLINPNHETVSTESACADKVICLYFAAQWAPPCADFLPDLKELYNEYQQQTAVGSSQNEKTPCEIVLISRDKNEHAWEDHFLGQRMPWLSLPFAEKKRNRALAKKFHVNSVPRLVVLRANDGQLITDDGRLKAREDPLNFPWAPAPFLHLLGPSLIRRRKREVSLDWEQRAEHDDGNTKELDDEELEEETVDTKSALQGRYVLLYFGALWSKPCQDFHPLLLDLYKTRRLSDRNRRTADAFSDTDYASIASSRSVHSKSPSSSKNHAFASPICNHAPTTMADKPDVAAISSSDENLQKCRKCERVVCFAPASMCDEALASTNRRPLSPTSTYTKLSSATLESNITWMGRTASRITDMRRRQSTHNTVCPSMGRASALEYPTQHTRKYARNMAQPIRLRHSSCFTARRELRDLRKMHVRDDSIYSEKNAMQRMSNTQKTSKSDGGSTKSTLVFAESDAKTSRGSVTTETRSTRPFMIDTRIERSLSGIGSATSTMQTEPLDHATVRTSSQVGEGNDDDEDDDDGNAITIDDEPATRLDFEIVYISCDSTEEAYKEQLAHMPWYAVPLSSLHSAKHDLARHVQHVKLPALVVLDRSGTTVLTVNGCSELNADPAGRNFPWYTGKNIPRVSVPPTKDVPNADTNNICTKRNNRQCKGEQKTRRKHLCVSHATDAGSMPHNKTNRRITSDAQVTNVKKIVGKMELLADNNAPMCVNSAFDSMWPLMRDTSDIVVRSDNVTHYSTTDTMDGDINLRGSASTLSRHTTSFYRVKSSKSTNTIMPPKCRSSLFSRPSTNATYRGQIFPRRRRTAVATPAPYIPKKSHSDQLSDASATRIRNLRPESPGTRLMPNGDIEIDVSIVAPSKLPREVR
eukprot:GEMP01003790.1.p1 GENE.GEMP01003790.1~~GEMP01003790.1.p1  ORF type:complete len:878 (+),score=176.68 GEMP01003790.1:429-3062(+)